MRTTKRSKFDQGNHRSVLSVSPLVDQKRYLTKFAPLYEIADTLLVERRVSRNGNDRAHQEFVWAGSSRYVVDAA